MKSIASRCWYLFAIAFNPKKNKNEKKFLAKQKYQEKYINYIF